MFDGPPGVCTYPFRGLSNLFRRDKSFGNHRAGTRGDVPRVATAGATRGGPRRAESHGSHGAEMHVGSFLRNRVYSVLAAQESRTPDETSAE